MSVAALGTNVANPAGGAPPPQISGSIDKLALDLTALRSSDPGAAASAQRQAEAALTPVERGQLAAALDAQAPSPVRQAFDAAMAAPGAVAVFQAGVREGLYEGAKDFVVGTVSLVGKTVQFSADVGPGGWLGDKLRSVTGELPSVVDAVVPSNTRGAATADGLGKTATAIRDYAVSRAADPGKLLSDTEGVIQKNWEALKSSHAEAAAKGPEAEAKWWGEVTGRAAFEIGATFVPVAGQASKVATGARVADAAVDGARLAERSGVAARALDDVPVAARPREIVMDGGKKGDWPAELNARQLEPNAIYRVNGYSYATDAQGRVTRVEGSLDLQTADRNGYQQGVAGRSDRLPDDQGGHLIASIFNGPGDRLNMVPMNGNLNMGAWKGLENKLANALQAGKEVDVKLEIIYPDNSARPDRFRVEYSIDGEMRTASFINRAGGK